MKQSLSYILKKIPSKFKKLKYYLFSKRFAKKVYDKKYFNTKYFETWQSIGWEWAYHDKWGRKHYDQNRNVPWPVFPNTFVPHPENIEFDPSSLNIFHSSGIYFQGIDAKTIIGKNCWVAQNVGFITSNHDFYDLEKHYPGKDIVIGDNCWIGMNAIILPGVVLGNNTVVGAGAVVTHSFPEGNCVIAGNPAKLIKKL